MIIDIRGVKMLRTIKAVYKKNRKSMLRAYPISFIAQRILSSLFALLTPIILYYFVFKENLDSEFINSKTNYLSFISLGYGAYAISIATLMNVGRAIISEIREGTIDSFLLTPSSRLGYFLGTFIEQFVGSIVEYFLVFIFSFFLGARYHLENVLGMTFGVIFISFISFSMSIILSNIMIYTRDTFICQNTLFLLLIFFSGVSFPVSYLPKWLQILSNLIPLTHAINILRDVTSGTIDALTIESIGIAIFEGMIYFFLGYKWFERLEKILIEEAFS